MVDVLARAVEAMLGRPAYVRQVKNAQEWFVTDPVFSFVQHGLRKGATGYRVGYFIGENTLSFYLTHSPLMASLFKQNLHLSAIIHAVRGCAAFCPRPWMMWSSKAAYREGDKWDGIEDDAEEFLAWLEEIDSEALVKDLFPKVVGKSGDKPATWAGNDFRLLLAENVDSLDEEAVQQVLEASWPLFLCLYPVSAIEHRIASLARSLQAARVQKQCEYSQIKNRPSEAAITCVCRGKIEGAHIKPHALGGNDRSENGLWLCQYHHRQTEGRIAGQRKDGVPDVTFTACT